MRNLQSRASRLGGTVDHKPRLENGRRNAVKGSPGSDEKLRLRNILKYQSGYTSERQSTNR